MTCYLLFFDADHIKDYVFATGRLRDIRGASEIVRRVSGDGIRAGFPRYDPTTAQGELIYAAGGNGLLLLSSAERATAVARQLEEQYREATLTGSLSTAVVPWESGGEDFGAAARRAAAKLRLRKAVRYSLDSAPFGGAVAFCQSCRQEPVAGSDENDRRQLLCESCRNKRAASRQQRRNLVRQPFWAHFTADMAAEQVRAWADPQVLDAAARDFGSIGARSRPAGYLGFCYSDGDGMGSLLEGVQKPEQYQALSAAIDSAVSGALGAALAKAYGSGNPLPAHPFEVIAAGGDDVLLVCTADQALPLAADYCLQFSTRLQQQITGDPILSSWWQSERSYPTASVGVVIAHDSMPVITLRERAGELLRNAKRSRVRTGWPADQGALDFHIVSTAVLDNIKSLRSAEYQAGNVLLLGRPYAVNRVRDLLADARAIRDIPASKRAEIYNAMFQAPFPAVLDLLRLQARLAPKQRQALLAAAEHFGWDRFYPYGEVALQTTGRFTGLVDLLEVADLAGDAAPEPRV